PDRAAAGTDGPAARGDGGLARRVGSVEMLAELRGRGGEAVAAVHRAGSVSWRTGGAGRAPRRANHRRCPSSAPQPRAVLRGAGWWGGGGPSGHARWPGFADG